MQWIEHPRLRVDVIVTYATHNAPCVHPNPSNPQQQPLYSSAQQQLLDTPTPPLETPRNKYYIPLTENQPIMPRGGEYTDGPTIQSDNAIESGENKIAGGDSVRFSHTPKSQCIDRTCRFDANTSRLLGAHFYS